VTASEAVVRDLMLRALPAPVAGSLVDWDSVLSRAGVASEPRRHMRRALVLALVALALGLLAIPATGVGSRLVDLFWEDGTPVDTSTLDRQAREFLEVVGAERAAVEEIASDGSRAFYLFRNDDGSTCISSGPADAKPRFGYTHCGRDVLRLLPSADWPLYKEVAATVGPGRDDVRSVDVTGLVLPTISRVVFVDSDGTVVAEDDVEDHVFELSMAPSGSLDAYAIVAYDDDGNEVHREPVLGRR
jgi:hypothetical protein